MSKRGRATRMRAIAADFKLVVWVICFMFMGKKRNEGALFLSTTQALRIRFVSGRVLLIRNYGNFD